MTKKLNLSHYIRSSVLGNEVVSEADSSGRKLKTYVRAAGATLAWQTVFYNTSNNTESEFINFEHRDASGLSYRSTANDGSTIYGEGAEGSPADNLIIEKLLVKKVNVLERFFIN